MGKGVKTAIYGKLEVRGGGKSTNLFSNIWRGTPGLGTCSLREEPKTEPNIPLKKIIPTLSCQTPIDPLVAISVWVFCARNSQREGRSLPRQGRDHLFQWGMGISVGFFTETTGSLRNTETRRTPSYVPPPPKPLFSWYRQKYFVSGEMRIQMTKLWIKTFWLLRGLQLFYRATS